MAVATNAGFGAELARALGLDPKTVTRIVLRADAGSVVSVDVRLLPTHEQVEQVAQLVLGHQEDLAKQIRTRTQEVEMISVADSTRRAMVIFFDDNGRPYIRGG